MSLISTGKRIVGFIFIIITASAYGNGSDDIRNLLLAANAYSKKATLTTEKWQSLGSRFDRLYMAPVGDEMFVRAESNLPGNLTKVILYRSGSGIFQWAENAQHEVIGNQVLHVDEDYGFTICNGLVDQFCNYSGTRYSLSSTSSQGIACYKVVVKIPGTDRDIAAFTGCPLERVTGREDSFLAAMEIWFAKDARHPFIFLTKEYNRQGKEVGYNNWGNVSLKEKLDPKIFELPDSKVKTLSEYGILQIEFGKTIFEQGRSAHQGVAEFLSDNTDLFLVWGSRIALWIAILAVVLVVIMKKWMHPRIHIIGLSFFVWGMVLPVRAGLTEDVERLREAYTATDHADFIAVRDDKVVRYQWNDSANGFVFRRQDVLKVGRPDFDNPEAIDQSSRWNPKGFFVIVGKRAVRSPISGLDWLPKYDFSWITHISIKNRDFNKTPCAEFRVEVKLPPDNKIAVTYWIDRDRPFIRGYEVFNDQNESVEKFDFGSVDFKPSLSKDAFQLPSGVFSEERKLDRSLERQVSRANDTAAIRRLQSVLDHTVASSFTASLKAVQGEFKSHYQVYQQSVAGRRLPLSRLDKIRSKEHPEVVFSQLVNREGSFWIYGSHAVKNTFPWFGIPPYLVLDAEPGLTVTESKSPDGNIVSTLRFSSVPPGIDRKEFLAVRKYYVRPDRFIYAWEAFTPDGKMAYRYEFEDIQFESKFPSGIFDLPRKVKMHEKKELEQVRARYFEDNIPADPGWFQRQGDRIGQFFERNIDSIFTWGGKITFCLAIAAAVLAIILKIRAKRRNQ